MPVSRAVPFSPGPEPSHPPQRANHPEAIEDRRALFLSDKDFDSYERRVREGCSAHGASIAIAGGSRMAMRKSYPNRPRAMEQQAGVGGQTEKHHENGPDGLFASGKPEGTAAPTGGRGQDRGNRERRRERGPGTLQN